MRLHHTGRERGIHLRLAIIIIICPVWSGELMSWAKARWLGFSRLIMTYIPAGTDANQNSLGERKRKITRIEGTFLREIMMLFMIRASQRGLTRGMWRKWVRVSYRKEFGPVWLKVFFTDLNKYFFLILFREFDQPKEDYHFFLLSL